MRTWQTPLNSPTGDCTVIGQCCGVNSVIGFTHQRLESAEFDYMIWLYVE
jgi:hypothetical protein